LVSEATDAWRQESERKGWLGAERKGASLVVRERGTEPGERAKKALGGVRVLEWAQFVAGPYCTKLMADLGAEVIKIEPPGVGDEARGRGPFPDDVPLPERSALFLYLNTNKRGVTLNVDTAAGKEVFRKLVEQVDILVEDNPPRLVQGWGLTYEELERINPNLVMTSITPFGQTGPYSDYSAYYLNTFHGSGFGYVTPSDPHNPQILEREPIMMGGVIAEYYCGVMAGIATLAALYARGAIGRGQFIDMSKQEAVFQSLKVNVPQYLVDGQVQRRVPTTLSPMSWGGILPCKDGYVNMMGAEAHQVQAVFELMGSPEWSKDEKYRPENFHLHALEIRPYVVEWVAERCREEIFHEGQRRRAPISAVLSVGESMNSEQMQARGFFVDVDHPEAGTLKYPLAPWRLSETPASLDTAAPLLGEHNTYVYRDLLGYTEQELAKMREAGAI